MSWPSTSTVPDVGISRPSSIEIVVVLPAPLPPSRATVVPRATVKSRPATASTLPNRLTRPSTLMTASGMESAIRPIWGMAAGRATAAAPPAKEFAMTGNEAVAGRAPAVETPGRVRLRTLVYIRWIAVLGQLLTLLVVHYGLGFDL